MKRWFAFIFGSPTPRALFWRVVYMLDFYGPKFLAVNQPARNRDVAAYRELQRAVRTDTDGSE